MISFTAEQRILVTGASSGLGRATARLLNSLGATVIASGRDRARLEEARQASVFPQRFVAECRDLVADMEELPAWVADLRQRWGKLYGLAFCAGQTWNVPLQAYDPLQARLAFDICCHAPLLTARGFSDRRNNTGAGACMVFLAAAAAQASQCGTGHVRRGQGRPGHGRALSGAGSRAARAARQLHFARLGGYSHDARQCGTTGP